MRPATDRPPSARAPARQDESRAALWAAAYFFFVFASYFVLRPIRDGLGSAMGSTRLAWVWQGTLLVTVLLHPLFSALVARTPRSRFVPIAYRFLGSNLLGFAAVFAIAGTDSQALARVFYVWSAAYVLFVVSVFWGFMADVFTNEQGKRLFGRIAAGGTLGAIAGSTLTKEAVERVGIWPLLVASVVLLECGVQAFRRLERASPGGSFRAEPREPAPAGGALAGFAQVARSRYLRAITAFVLLYTLTSGILYFLQADLVRASAASAPARARTFADLSFWTNAAALAAQLLLTGPVLRRIGVGASLAAVPVVTLAGFAWLAAAPTVAFLRVFQATRNATEYAFTKPARDLLYTVVPTAAKYQAKTLVDTFVYRAGDAIAGFAWIGLASLTAAPPGSGIEASPAAVTALVSAACVAWTALAIGLGREQRRRAAEAGTGPPIRHST